MLCSIFVLCKLTSFLRKTFSVTSSNFSVNRNVFRNNLLVVILFFNRKIR